MKNNNPQSAVHTHDSLLQHVEGLPQTQLHNDIRGHEGQPLPGVTFAGLATAVDL